MIEQKRIQTGELVILYRSTGTDDVVIIFPGIGYSKTGPYFLLSNIAQDLYKNGKNVVMFDYYGLGDSEGDETEVTYTSLLCSGKNVLSFTGEIGYRNVIIIGLGVGNLICNELAGEKDIKGMYLMDYSLSRFRDCGKNSDLFLRNLIGLKWDTYIHSLFPKQLIINEERCMRYKKCSYPVYCLGEEQLTQIDPFLNSLNPQDWTDEARLARAWDRMKDSVVDWILNTAFPITERECLLTEDEKWNDNNTEGEELIDIQGLLGILKYSKKIGCKSAEICIIYEPGLGGNRVDYMRAGVKAGEALSEKGFWFFRYDFYGCGVSVGEFYKFSWGKKFETLKMIMNYLKEHYEIRQFMILSYSEGAKIAVRAAKEYEDVKAAVMWSPVLINGMDYSCVREEERKNVKIPKFIKDKRRGIVLPTQAYYLGLNYFSDQKKYQIYEDLSDNIKPLKIIYGKSDTLFQSDIFLNPEAGFECECLEVGHLFNSEVLRCAIDSALRFFEAAVD